MEVSYVLNQGWLTRNRVLPLVFLNNPPEEFSGIYSKFQNILYLETDPENNEDFEKSIAKICRYLDVPYYTPFLAHTRLPFTNRFQKEIKNWNLEIAIHEELMLIIDTFSKKYAAKDYITAEEIISYFLLTCKYRLPDFNPYYPRIVKGVCQIQVGKLSEAEETFLKATEHPNRDENCFGGLGQVYFRQKRYLEACNAYNKALEICPPDLNKEILFNKLGAQIQAGEELIDLSFLDQFDINNFDGREKLSFYNMKGIAFYQKGDYKAATRVFNKITSPNTTTIIYYYLSLNKLGRYTESLHLLKESVTSFDDPVIYHYLAHALWHAKEDKKAIRIYREKLLKMKPYLRQYWIEYARMLRQQDLKKMKQACRHILDRKSFPLPHTEEDYFYEGFANYLLGHHSRAQYDYERSGNFCKDYYDKILD